MEFWWCLGAEICALGLSGCGEALWAAVQWRGGPGEGDGGSKGESKIEKTSTILKTQHTHPILAKTLRTPILAKCGLAKCGHENDLAKCGFVQMRFGQMRA